MSRMWGTGNIGRTAGVSALTAVLVAGCSSGESCSVNALHGRGLEQAMAGSSNRGAVAASCAAGVEYRGRFYLEWSADLPVAKGRLLGAAVYPPCNDTGGSCAGEGPEATGRPTQVWAMRGVDPDRVVIARQQGVGRFEVFGRLHDNPRHYFRFADGNWHIRDGLAHGR